MRETTCQECNTAVIGTVKLKDIALICGRFYPIIVDATIEVEKNMIDFMKIKLHIAREYRCAVRDVKLSLCEYFKIPGEALEEIGYGVESCGIVCPRCNTIIYYND